MWLLIRARSCWSLSSDTPCKDLVFKEWKNDSMWALSLILPGRFLLCLRPLRANCIRYSYAAYSIPPSLWNTRLAGGLRLPWRDSRPRALARFRVAFSCSSSPDAGSAGQSPPPDSAIVPPPAGRSHHPPKLGQGRSMSSHAAHGYAGKAAAVTHPGASR